jgi:D-3-phosphoglycerate dehydrogenase
MAAPCRNDGENQKLLTEHTTAAGILFYNLSGYFILMRILIADQMEEDVVESIREVGTVDYRPKDLEAALPEADALVVRSATKVTKELLSHAARLRLVVRAGVGLDNVDVPACEARGIKVMNTPGASTEAVAELTIGLIICLLRNVGKAHFQMKKGIWDKKSLTGKEIGGKTLGIVGYGRIGSSVGRKAAALGMRVIAYSPPPRREDGIARYVESLDELFAQSDIVTLHTVLTPQTRCMINKSSIAKMKNGAYIINAARGGLIDEDALYDACRSRKIAGAALDVYEAEPYKGKLLELDNIIFTPHIGAGTVEAQARIGEELVAILKKELR